ncbi:hypothetical protein GCM10027062_13940 [Nocardioides hungaricus]
MSAPAVVAPGRELLPGYVAVRLLSRGHRLDTYDAWSEERGCRCVVKTVRPDRLGEERIRAAALTEGRILLGIAHPHLVRCYEVVEDPVPAVVLETLTGQTLDALVDRRPLHPDDAAELGLQLSSALAHVHSHGWLHLDVKPENVVVQAGRAVLLDLSLAQRPGPGAPGAGTEEYLAPEQHDALDLGPATDVWGLGQTLVESLTREIAQPGWPDGSPALPRVAPAFRRRRLDPAYRSLLEACLAPDPALRPTLAEVGDVLSRARRPRR